jgi:hypothetical protein
MATWIMADRETNFSIPQADVARACDVANASEDIFAMEQDFDAISADMAEPWIGAAAR